jgi:pimeloyl-ACP methyl ester carboxylesterase
MIETGLYSETRKLYTVHYRAESGRYLIMLPPLFEEMPRTRKLLINLARDIAQKGVNVVRFDYRGTGLSHGQFSEFSLSQAMLDLDEAVSYCQTFNPVSIQVLGFRFGGYLAIKHLSEHSHIHKTILWEPVLDLKLYWDELMRIALANQLITFGVIKQGKEELLAALKNNGEILIDGYSVSFQAYQEFINSEIYSCDKMLPLKDRISAILWHNKKAHEKLLGSGLRSWSTSADKPAWDSVRYVNYRFPELFQKTIDEIIPL